MSVFVCLTWILQHSFGGRWNWLLKVFHFFCNTPCQQQTDLNFCLWFSACALKTSQLVMITPMMKSSEERSWMTLTARRLRKKPGKEWLKDCWNGIEKNKQSSTDFDQSNCSLVGSCQFYKCWTSSLWALKTFSREQPRALAQFLREVALQLQSCWCQWNAQISSWAVWGEPGVVLMPVVERVSSWSCCLLVVSVIQHSIRRPHAWLSCLHS